MMLWVFSVRAIDNIDFKIFRFANSGAIDNSNSTTLAWETPGSSSQNATSDVEWDDWNTYILITGRWGWNHDAPDLTDTIILAGLNYDKEVISLFSLPRDLWVDYPGSTISGKINRIYETYVPKWRDIAISKLKEKVTEITGKNIDYYMNLDFEGFVQVVDILWWVEVTLTENFADYEYPAGPWRYKTFILRKWTWSLDGEVALMYARSRHSTSDFDRSLRQQQIISSVREKVWNLWYFRDSKTLLDLYSTFNDYVETDMSVSDMVSIGLKIKKWDDSKTLSFNLNDSCYEWSPTCSSGGFLYVPLREYFWGASALLPKKAIAVKPWYYTDIQKFSTLMYDTPEIFTNPVDIKIYNAWKVPFLAARFANELIPYGIDIDNGTDLKTLRNTDITEAVIYYNTIPRDNALLRYLESITDLNIIPIDKPKYSTDPETRIEVVLIDNNSF